MAYQFPYTTKSGKVSRYYNIDWPVGLSAANRKDDVMLVQTLFHILYHETEGFSPPLAVDEIEVTGECDATTRAYIRYFKRELLLSGERIYPDEVLDPIRDNDPDKKSTISRTRYALTFLVGTTGIHKLDRLQGLPEDESTPVLLRQALKQTRKTAQKYGG